MSDTKLDLPSTPVPALPLNYVAEAPHPLAFLVRAVGVLVAAGGTMQLAVRICASYFSSKYHIAFGGPTATLPNSEIVFAVFQMAAGLAVAIRPRLIGLLGLWALCRIALSLIGLVFYLYFMFNTRVNRQAINIVPYQILSSIRSVMLESLPPLMVLFIYLSWKRFTVAAPHYGD